MTKQNTFRVLNKGPAGPTESRQSRRRYEHFQSRAQAEARMNKLLSEGKFDIRIYKDPANHTRYELSYMEYYTPRRPDY